VPLAGEVVTVVACCGLAVAAADRQAHEGGEEGADEVVPAERVRHLQVLRGRCCEGGVRRRCAREVCEGGVRGRCAREVCEGGVQGRCAAEVCEGGVRGRCAREVCGGGVQGRCAAEVCKGGVRGRCAREWSCGRGLWRVWEVCLGVAADA
jgi:hypothetical protein